MDAKERNRQETIKLMFDIKRQEKRSQLIACEKCLELIDDLESRINGILEEE